MPTISNISVEGRDARITRVGMKDEVSPSKSVYTSEQSPMPPFFASPRRISLGLINFLSWLNLVRPDNEGSSLLFFLAAESGYGLPYSNRAQDSPRIHNYLCEGFLDVSNILK